MSTNNNNTPETALVAERHQASPLANPSVATTTVTTPVETVPPPPPQNYTWKLPEGIEDYLEQGIVKTAVGAAVGGVFGILLFKSGKGGRLASVSTGVGVGLGSTYERASYRYNGNKLRDSTGSSYFK